MAARLILRLGIALAAAGMAWFVAVNGVAAALLRSGNIAGAAALAPDADRMAQQAEILLQQRRYADAATLARRSLAVSPLQTRAARVLGMAELAMGRTDAGLPAMDVAAHGGWRDTPTQLWLLQAALGAGDYDSALQRSDVLIRRDAATDQVFAMFRAMDGERGFRQSLIARLADRPDWRGLMFLDFRRAAPGELAGLGQLVADMQHSAQPATDLELFPLVERLLELGETGSAYALWRTKAPAAGWISGNLLYDGRFAVAQARQGQGTPPRFEWWIDPDGTGQASVEPAPDGRGSSLQAIGQNGEAHVLAAQALALSPGKYRLVARLFARDSRDWSGFEFAVRCLPMGSEAVLEPRLRPLRLEQLGYVADFAVPAGCTRQDLYLRTTGESGSATVSVGEIGIEANG
jgi:hypothetical protein